MNNYSEIFTIDNLTKKGPQRVCSLMENFADTDVTSGSQFRVGLTRGSQQTTNVTVRTES